MALLDTPSRRSSPQLVNVTVDDQLGDPITGLVPEYLPNNGTWHAGSPTEHCPTCAITAFNLDLSQIHNQTWHDGTNYPPGPPATITVSFTGSAVYVFNILANILPQTDTYTNISFSIDGEGDAIFSYTPDSSPISYNHLVYQNTMLQHGPHTLVMSAGGISSSLILFDYLLYTTRENDIASTSTTASSTITQSSSLPVNTSTHTSTSTRQPSYRSLPSAAIPIGAIVGGVIGGFAVLLWVVTGLFLLRRHHARSKPPQDRGYASTASMVSVTAIGSPPSGDIEPNALSSPEDPSMETGPLSRSDVSGPELDTFSRSSPLERSRSSSASARTERRLDELMRELGALRCTESLPASCEAPHGATGIQGQGCNGSGLETVIVRLEAEIATLRSELAALRSQFPGEPLPPYVE